ncbi:MAG TPA: ABATE domain-containing protein [Anaerolineales bacterium]|jgi:predicted RNA-binding Zn ribbon-like protein
MTDDRMQAAASGFDPALRSGHPALEFTNTVNDHAGAAPGETLFEYGQLLSWGNRVGLLTPDRVRALTRAAARRPTEAAQVFSRALGLREALYRIFVAQATRRPPARSDLAVLNRTLASVMEGARIAPDARGFNWNWNLRDTALDLPLRVLALSAVDLLTSRDIRRVGQCADEAGCGWLFVDTSKNHSRRWCDINDCGNRAKQRRYQARRRKAK